MGSVKPRGAAAGDFMVTADECSGETLQPGGSCSLMVRFAPSAVCAVDSLVVNHAGAVPLTVTSWVKASQRPAKTGRHQDRPVAHTGQVDQGRAQLRSRHILRSQ
jgi:hypothetical protein